MKVIYFDCFSGASGDMIAGALLDAGMPVATLQTELAKLPLAGYRIAAERVVRQGFGATRFEVRLDPQAPRPHRHLSHIRQIIEPSDLSPRVRQRALRIFERLAAAEAEAHQTDPEKIHFHEVGAIDAIVDIVTACIGLDWFAPDRIVCSPLPTGSGTVECEHGLLPVPAPGTAALLRGFPIAGSDEPGELTTPTGAAILTTVADAFGPLPAMRLEQIGYGAGQRDGQRRPNLLRVLIGQTSSPADADEIVILQANVDDAPGETVGYALERLFRLGALDAYCTPVYMKKNRPGIQITVLADPGQADQLEQVLYEETTTFGVRRFAARRSKLERRSEQVQTEFGPIRIKLGTRQGRLVTASPEFEDCRRAAQEHGRPLREVMQHVIRAWQIASGQKPS